MVILLAGTDSYRRQERLREILSAYIERHGHTGAEFFNPDAELGDFFNFIRAKSMFNPVRLAVLSGFSFGDFSGKNLEDFKYFLSQSADDKSIVIVLSSSDSPEGDLSFLIEKAHPCEFFEPLSGGDLEAFIKKEAKNRAVSLTGAMLKDLINLFKGDIWSIMTELDKLALSSNQSIEKDVFGSLDLFPLINALKFGKAIDRKLVALELLTTKLKEDPAKIFNILAASAPKTMKPSDWFHQMADYDIAIKSGKLDYEGVLLDFVLQ